MLHSHHGRVNLTIDKDVQSTLRALTTAINTMKRGQFGELSKRRCLPAKEIREKQKVKQEE